MCSSLSPASCALRIRLAAIALSVSLAGCGSAATTAELSGEALGTTFSVQIVDTGGGFDRQRLREEILDALAEIDRRFSTWRDDSDVSRFNASRSTAWQPVPALVCDAVTRALQISVATGGAFDVTVGPLVELWGFGRRQANEMPDDSAIDRLMPAIGHEKLETDCSRPALRKRHRELAVDLSGFAKGLAADLVAERLDADGQRRYLVEIGGEIRARGRNARGRLWAIAIENPVEPGGEPVAVISLANGGLATSGDYRNRIEFASGPVSHILDPRSGRPAAHALASVTVLAESAAAADGFATALLVMGADDGLRFAAERGLAASLHVKTDEGVRQITTPAFEARENAR